MEAVGRDLFHSTVTLVVLNQSEEDERTGKKEHVVFLVKQTKQTSESTEQRGDSEHKQASGQSLCILCVCCSCLIFICVHLFFQEEFFRIMKDKCASLTGKMRGWDLLRAIVSTANGTILRDRINVQMSIKPAIETVLS